MPMQKYLMILRTAPVTGKSEPPSPAQMQAMYAQFTTWKEKFQDNILDMVASSNPEAKSSPPPV